MASDAIRFDKSRAHQARAHAAIPGGAHTYAKGDDQMPEAMPIVIESGSGCRVRDVDGNSYIEYGMGLRAVTLGHAEPRVVAAAQKWMLRGANFSRPASIELDAAEALLDLLPAADMVKFCKDGSSATTAAVKLARAATGRALVAMCVDHPFLSQDDWFIANTPMPAGIPKAVADLTVGFPYGESAALDDLFAAYPDKISCVIMEATRGPDDPSAYLREVRDICHRNGAVFVLDEMITGFRWSASGAQGLFGIEPDLSTFGKALANGFSVSALAGKRELMELGGLRTDQDRVFLLSSTHGAETHALAAAIEAMRITCDDNACGVMHRQGERLRLGVEAAIREAGLSDYVGVAGRDCNLVYTTADADGTPSQPFRTLMLQELALRGVLAPSLVISAAHDDASVDETVSAFVGALAVYGHAIEDQSVEKVLLGRPVQPVFRPHAGTVWSDDPIGKSRALSVRT